MNSNPQHIEVKSEQISQKLTMWFNEKVCETLAIHTGFIQRSSSRLTGKAFFNLLTAGTLSEPTVSYEGLCDHLDEVDPNIQITPQGLCNRMNSEGAVNFLKAAMEKTLNETTQKATAAIHSDWLAPFQRVLLQDSTQIQIHEKMASQFKGSGGNASTACVKVDYCYDVKSETTENVTLRQGVDSDQGFANDLVGRVKKNDLIIRDLGYFSLDFFVQMGVIGAWFLSRLAYQSNVYARPEDEQAMCLIGHINCFGKNQKSMDFPVFLGKKQRIPVRLIVYRLPKHVYKKRQKGAIKTAKRKGRKVSLSYLKFLKYSFYVTNVPMTQWSAEAVGTIYRLRWQVELAFKNWKSLFRIDILKGTRPQRIQSLIYGRLIVILVVQQILALIVQQTENSRRELSYYKAIQWLQRGNRLMNAFLKADLEDLLFSMLSKLKRMLKQKRNRQTTRELIQQQVGYLDSFNDIPCPAEIDCQSLA